MKEKRKRVPAGSKPKAFHPNSTCSQYFSGEIDFIIENTFSPATERKIREAARKEAAFYQDSSIPLPYRLSPSYYFRDQIARCMDYTASGSTYSDEVVTYVVQAVKRFGVDALYLNASDKFRINPISPEEIRARAAKLNILGFEAFRPEEAVTENFMSRPLEQMKDSGGEAGETAFEGIEEPILENQKDPRDYLHPLAKAKEERELFELRYRDGLGPVICNVLRYWQERAIKGDLKERRLAANHLRAFGAALIPNMKGRRGKVLTASYYEVKKFYLKELYRLYHIEHFFKSSEGPRNLAKKVRKASDKYGLSVEAIRDFRGLNEDYERYRQALHVKDMARELTAHHFKISPQRVSNILSS